jgi:hypothetical protein
MHTVYVVAASATALLTIFGVVLAKLVPDEYDQRTHQLAPARSRAIRVRR